MIIDIMKILDIAELSLAPIILMIYGWYLGQLHQSGPDIAGILMFITGVIGLLIAFSIYYFTKSKKWYINILLGIIGCLVVFMGIVVYARIHG